MPEVRGRWALGTVHTRVARVRGMQTLLPASVLGLHQALLLASVLGTHQARHTRCQCAQTKESLQLRPDVGHPPDEHVLHMHAGAAAHLVGYG